MQNKTNFRDEENWWGREKGQQSTGGLALHQADKGDLHCPSTKGSTQPMEARSHQSRASQPARAAAPAAGVIPNP